MKLLKIVAICLLMAGCTGADPKITSCPDGTIPDYSCVDGPNGKQTCEIVDCVAVEK